MTEQNVVVVNSRASGVQFSTPHFRLVPGENDVPKSVLESNLSNPNRVVKGWFDPESGFLSIKSGAKKAKPIAENLSNVTANRAKAIIEQTDRIDVLQKWAKHEGRSTVNQALKKRIRQLEAPKEDED